MYNSPPDSSATYSSSGWNATAIEAGSVHGVVVQMMVETFLPASAAIDFAGSLVMRVLHPDAGAGVVLVLDLGFGQRGVGRECTSRPD